MQYVDVVPVVAVALGACVLATIAGALARSAVRSRVVLVTLLAGAVAVTLVVTLGPVETVSPADPSLNLVPLRDILAVLRSGNGELAVLNLVGNALLFAPVGFLLTLLLRRAGLAVLGGIALSVAEEALQYLVGRAADVDDVLLNAAGTVLGALAALAVRALWVRTRSESTHPDGGAPGRA